MTGYLLGRDAAFASNIGTWDGTVLGYLGGPGAYHTWAASDWAPYRGNPKIPIWVTAQPGSPPGRGGEEEGKEARDALRDLGVPPGRVVMLDLEERVDKTYVRAFGAILNEAGFKVWPYGPTSTLFGNPALNGYAVADPTGVEHMFPHPGVRMTQWAFGPRFDNDAIREWLLYQDDLWI